MRGKNYEVVSDNGKVYVTFKSSYLLKRFIADVDNVARVKLIDGCLEETLELIEFQIELKKALGRFKKDNDPSTGYSEDQPEFRKGDEDDSI